MLFIKNISVRLHRYVFIPLLPLLHYRNSDITFGPHSTMGKSSFSCLVVITVSLSVYKSCVACSEGSNDNLEGILGGNINLTCNTIYQCDSFQWDKPTLTGVLRPSGEQIQVGYSKSYLLISGIRFDDDGRYRCICYVSSGPSEICKVHLKAICQATVILKGRRDVSKIKDYIEKVSNI